MLSHEPCSCEAFGGQRLACGIGRYDEDEYGTGGCGTPPGPVADPPDYARAPASAAFGRPPVTGGRDAVTECYGRPAAREPPAPRGGAAGAGPSVVVPGAARCPRPVR
ncbi:hypothetical protein GCM10010495_72030 [Kitasatospora herbaricolor]|nr:hypothetical protein GCM10010495_72030 [Kitasatospora herbaricolor]